MQSQFLAQSQFTQPPAAGTATKYQYEDDRYFQTGDKEEDKMLKELDFYHGFLPREDLQFLIKKDGDFILRTSEVDAPSQSAESLKSKRELVLSLYSDLDTENNNANNGAPTTTQSDLPPPENPRQGAQTPHESKLASKRYKQRNMIIKRTPKNKYTIEPERQFETLKELFAYYQANFGVVTKIRFMLKNGIKLQPWELLHKDIELNKDKLLGEGAYGEVRPGILKCKGEKDKEVAVKVTKSMGDLTKVKIKEMMREARLMRNLKHPNIVRLWGVAVDEQPLYIVLELIKGGALNSFLQKNKCTMEEKMSMVLGAARGVDHLHKNGIIHRDLAARNCLYDNIGKCVKISDFGLSRKDVKTYKIKAAVKLPIKWLAPETITAFIFTVKTDVWSFGVMTFEIFADGNEPWEGVTNTEVKKAVTAGKCVPMKDKGIPDPVQQFLATKVFLKDAHSRCEMEALVKFFETLIDPSCADAGAEQSTPNAVTASPAPPIDEKEDGKKDKLKGTKVSAVTAAVPGSRQKEKSRHERPGKGKNTTTG